MNVADQDSSLNLWHRWLGYISQKVLKVLVKEEHLSNFKNTKIDLCTNCIVGKQHRVSFAKKAAPLKRTHMLESVHIDM